MLLEVKNVQKSFGTGEARTEVLRGVSLTLEAGQSLALTGESGSGKSTLMHLIAGLDTPDAGTIQVAGDDIGAMSDIDRATLRR